jgi:hypothetical protein
MWVASRQAAGADSSLASYATWVEKMQPLADAQGMTVGELMTIINTNPEVGMRLLSGLGSPANAAESAGP